jgi:hypothetical protein
MAIPKKKKVNDLFFITFIGEHVSVLTDFKTSQSVQTEEGTLEETSPLVIQGYMLDMDDDFYYLGETAEEIRAVRKTTVSAIEITKPQDEFSDILDSVKTPENKKGYN